MAAVAGTTTVEAMAVALETTTVEAMAVEAMAVETTTVEAMAVALVEARAEVRTVRAALAALEARVQTLKQKVTTTVSACPADRS